MHVVDVGANLGVFSILFSDLVGASGRVTAFEPEPALFRALQSNIAENRIHNLRAYNCAVGARSDRLRLHLSISNSGDNRLSAGKGLRQYRRTVAVQVKSLDEVLCGQRVDVVKLDTQGWEYNILSGMKDLMRANPGMIIYFEFWPRGIRLSGCEPKAIIELLERFGFSVFSFLAGRHGDLRTMQDGVQEASAGYTNLLAMRV
jgi:FkbM family methyltransferase